MARLWEGGKEMVNPTLSSNSAPLPAAFQMYLSPFWSSSTTLLMKRALLITACQVEPTVAALILLVQSLPERVFIFLHLSEGGVEKACMVTVNGKRADRVVQRLCQMMA